MGFQGAETAALREQATAFQRCGREMLQHSSTLTSAVMSVTWVGPDADALRARWAEVDRLLTQAAEDVTARGRELAEHAQEQDAASSDGSGGGRSLGDRLGLPDLSSWFTTAAGPLSEAVGWARTLAEAVAPGGAGGPGSGNPLLAALDPGGSKGAGADQGIQDLINDLFGLEPVEKKVDKYDGDYDSPEDEFDATPGEGVRTLSSKLEGDHGSIETSVDEDGNRSGTVQISAPLVDEEGKAGPVEASYSLDVKTSGSFRENGDGTVTYTVTSELSEEAKAELAAKGVNFSGDVGVNSGSSRSTEYEVTVPEGTSIAEVLAITPHDPSSIPPGASVSFSSERATSGGADVGIGVVGDGLFSIGAQESNGEGTTTSVGRDSDGNLTVTTGPTSAMNSTVTARLGTDDLNLHIAQSDSRDGSTFETATFEDTASGRRAYQEALTNGKYPSNTGDGVLTTYVENQRTRTVDVAGGVTTGPASSELSSNMFTQQSITRTYPDGHQESAAQWLPHGDSSMTSVVRSDASGREPTYVVTLDTSGGSRAATSSYGLESPGDRTSILLTEDEASVVRDHARALKLVPDDAGTAEALSMVVQRSSDADAAISNLEGHNAIADSTGKSEPVGGDYRAPGRAFNPEHQSVRDGKLADRH